MPSSTVRAFVDPDEYFAGIRNLQIEGVVLQRGEFHAESTIIDLPRVLMCRFDENLPRIMKVTPSGRRAGILFATNPDQRAVLMNGAEISQGQIAAAGLRLEWYLRSSAPCEWGTMSLTPEDLAAAGETIIGRELAPPTSLIASPLHWLLCRSCGSCTTLRATSRKPPRTSSRSPRWRERWNRFGGSDGFLPSRRPVPRCAQCPAQSRKSDAARGGDADGEP